VSNIAAHPDCDFFCAPWVRGRLPDQRAAVLQAGTIEILTRSWPRFHVINLVEELIVPGRYVGGSTAFHSPKVRVGIWTT
jgi:hypothetical protein